MYYPPAVNGIYPPPVSYVSYPPPPVTFVPVAQRSPEQVNQSLFQTHCSRVGLTLMADLGIMLGGEMLVMIVGMIAFLLLKDSYFPGVNQTEAMLNVTMLALAVVPCFSHFIPAAAHGHKWGIRPLDPFRGDRLSGGFIAAATATALGLNAMWGYVYYFANNWLQDNTGVNLDSGSMDWLDESMTPVGFGLYIIAVCIVAPVMEEYIFRGMLLRTLSQHGAGFGIVITALLFGLMHGNLAQTPMAFLIGLILGYVAAKSGNIRQTICIHMINNTLASIPQAVQYFAPQYEDFVATVDFAKDVLCMLFAVAALIWFAVKRHKGIKARNWRLQVGSPVAVSPDELTWAKLEIPESRRIPQWNLVKHKIGLCLASGGMIFFWVSMLLLIVMSTLLPFLTAALPY